MEIYKILNPGKILLFLLILCLSKISVGQNPGKNIDSLLQNIKTGKEDTSRVNNLNVLSTSFWLIGDFTKAMSYANEAFDLADKLKYRKGIVNAYNEIGFIYVEMGNYPEALKNHFASLSIEEKMNDKEGIVNSLINIGNVYFEQRNFSEALNNYNACLKVAEENGFKKAIARCYNNIGNVYFKKENYAEALKSQSLALKIGNEIQDKNIIARAYVNIGNAYSSTGDLPNALKNYLASVPIEEEMGDKTGMAASYINLGDLNIDLGKPLTSKEYYQKALDLCKEIGNKGEMAYCYNGLSIVDSITGNLNEAYWFSHLYSRTESGLLNEKSDKHISQLKIEYETDKKDQQIKTQMLQNVILQNRIYYNIAISLIIIGIIVMLFYLRNRRKKREYEHTLVELELTALKSQLNPHFISNSLIAIKTFIDSQPEKASQFLMKFAKLMRRVLDQSELPSVSLKQELETSELYMQIEALRLEHGFDYKITCDPAIDAGNIIVPSLILQPSIENAIRHGLAPKKEKGFIHIVVKQDGNLLKFVIEDNGIGKKFMNEKPIQKNEKSFGLSITRKRVDILSKQLNIKGYVDLKFLPESTITEIALPVI